MHRIDGPSATSSSLFTEGSPTGGIPATVVTDDWLNDVQENIARAIEGAGIALVKGDYTQLLAAISAQLLTKLPKRTFAMNDFIRIPDVPGGLIIQWVSLANPVNINVGTPFSWPTQFPSALRAAAIAPDFTGANASATLAIINRSANGAQLVKTLQTGTFSAETNTTIIAIGN